METLKTAPRGFPKDHPRIELLRHKGLVAMKSWPAASWLETAAAKKRVADVFHAAAPLLSWLHGNVGPAEDDRERGDAQAATALTSLASSALESAFHSAQ